jgi:hypothetical protein
LQDAGEQIDRDARGGIDLLKSPLRLGSPTPEHEAEIEYRVRSIYERAYGIVLEEPQGEPDVRISIRSEIRRWITKWDIARYYPEYRADVEIDEVHFDPEAIGDDRIAAEDEEQD